MIVVFIKKGQLGQVNFRERFAMQASQTVDKVTLEFMFQSNFSVIKRNSSKIEFLSVFLSSSSPPFCLNLC